MRGNVYLFLTGSFFLLLQSSVLPFFLPTIWRPDLLLILIVLVAVREKTVRVLVVAMLFGATCDSFSGTTVGLHIFIYLVVVAGIRLVGEKLNVENPSLLILIILAATLTQSVIAGFLLAALADFPGVLVVLVEALPAQMLSNLAATLMILTLVALCSPRLLFRDAVLSRGDVA